MAPLETNNTPLNTPISGTVSTADLEATIAHLKRTIADLEATAPSGPNKRLTSTVTLGRGYRRVCSMFQDISTLVQEADHCEEDDSEDEGDTAPSPEAMRNRDHTFTAYQELVCVIPGFKTNLLNTDSGVLASYYAMLTRGANEARSNDICAIKKNVAKWLNQS
ncbi:hypothetical protein H0H81_003568, partial [Sphagnurus paluster]